MKTKKCSLLVLLVVHCALFLCTDIAYADNSEEGKNGLEEDLRLSGKLSQAEVLRLARALKISPLRGLRGVQPGAAVLTMSWLQGEKDKFEFTRDLQTQLELALRTAGIAVVAGDRVRATGEGTLLVWVEINYVGVVASSPHYVFTMRTELSEDGVLLRDLKIQTAVTTWKCDNLKIACSDEVEDMVKKELGRQMNEFCNDYLAANPKQTDVKSNSGR